ncbi:MAG: fibrobacter succinogenes major paralogous domain-containing protein, partial [Bacteroidales bacterium]|nr:fibrobacter succinogenes major paralogous domain-containing protein [Bacteroidales bacterium]
TGLAETDTITGTITTESYAVGTYVCEEGSFNAYAENGIAVKSGFAINHGLGNYTPDFDVTLTIDNIDQNFHCPADLHLVLKEGNADTMLVFTDSATLDPMVDNIVISSNLNSLNPITAGTHTIVWTLADDLGNVMATCNQTVEVVYTPCIGVTYHGHFYDAKRIGFQCWMTENLRDSLNSHDEEIADYHAYHESTDNLDKFGYLYSWYSAMNVAENDNSAALTYSTGDNGQPYVQGICPDGWAVGNLEDFTALFNTVNNTTLLKDAGNGYWLPEFSGTLPNSGFNARGNGFYNSLSQRYEDLLTGAHFWLPESGTAAGTATSAVLQYYCSDGLFQESPKGDLKGVRCIRKVEP